MYLAKVGKGFGKVTVNAIGSLTILTRTMQNGLKWALTRFVTVKE